MEITQVFLFTLSLNLTEGHLSQRKSKQVGCTVSNKSVSKTQLLSLSQHCQHCPYLLNECSEAQRGPGNLGCFLISLISSSNSPCCSCFPCRDIKQKRNSAGLTPANAVTQDLPLPHWDILLVVAIFQMLLNSGHSPVKNNYKHLIQDNLPSVFKHYSCAHIQRLIMFLEKTNVLAERRSTNCFGF